MTDQPEQVGAVLQSTLAAMKPFQLSPEREVALQRDRQDQEERQRLIQYHTLLKEACVPERHRKLISPAVLKEGNLWSESYARMRDKIGQGFLAAFLGPRGTGKTQMAVCLIDDACRNNRTARYVKALDLFRELRATFRDDGENELSVVRRFRKYHLLVIDEAHERGNTDFESRTLTNIIDHRYDDAKDTVLISNDSLQAFAAAIGPSIVDRLNETGEAIEFDWPSYRE